MNKKPLVSVIVPTRNRGLLIKPCLDGINSQSFNDYEVLIIDDGSSLDSRLEIEQLLNKYDDRFILNKIHAPDTKGSGASYIRNLGISLAKGEYLAFCDDDDYWCRDNYLQSVISTLNSNNGDICFSGIEVRDSEGNIILDKMMKNVEKTLSSAQKLKDSNLFLVNQDQIICYPDYAHLNITITRKSLAENVYGFWPYSTYAEDVGFFILLCDQAEKIYFQPEICAVHNAPEQRKSESISNRIKLEDKRLLEISVYQYLLMNCQTEQALNYVRKSLANTLKMVTGELIAKGKVSSAISYARMAWGAYPTLKWGGYTLWLSAKLIF